MTTYAWVCPYCDEDRTDVVDPPGPGAPKRPAVRPGGPTSPGLFEPTPLCPHCECDYAPYWEERPASPLVLADALAALDAAWRGGAPLFYTTSRNREDPMVNTPTPEPVPSFNPYRRGCVDGYLEREAVAQRQLGDAYDAGWRAGMNEPDPIDDPPARDCDIQQFNPKEPSA